MGRMAAMAAILLRCEGLAPTSIGLPRRPIGLLAEFHAVARMGQRKAGGVVVQVRFVYFDMFHRVFMDACGVGEATRYNSQLFDCATGWRWMFREFF